MFQDYWLLMIQIYKKISKHQFQLDILKTLFFELRNEHLNYINPWRLFRRYNFWRIFIRALHSLTSDCSNRAGFEKSNTILM